jgi:L-alanine-DL-glutamate epimerase-like enolase superfamily enzyme
MRIRKVQSFLLSYPFSDQIKLPFFGGERTIVKRDAMLIRVEADNGLVGYAPGPGSERMHAAIEGTIGPFLKGHVLADADALRVQFSQWAAGDLDLAKAYAAVEIGLHDLIAKESGLPLSEVLGGRIRDRIRLYGSAGMYMAPDRYAAEAAAIVQLGFRAYKMRPALGPEKDLLTVQLMREAVGGDIDLMVDAHTWWCMGDRSYDFDTVEQMAGE